jgi:hypothetical protein
LLPLTEVTMSPSLQSLLNAVPVSPSLLLNITAVLGNTSYRFSLLKYMCLLHDCYSLLQ